MITIEQLELLEQFPTSSWAIWSNDSEVIEDSLFFKKRVNELHSNTMLIGLNPSNQTIPYANFHNSSKTGDKYLRELLNDKLNMTNLYGSYMTDISVKVEPNSQKLLISKLDSRKELLDKLDVLNNKPSRFICFGVKAFNTLVSCLGVQVSSKIEHDINYCKFTHKNKEKEVYGCYHYSNRGYNHRQVEKLAVQLKYINDNCF